MSKDEMNKKLLQQVNSLTSTVDSLNATINAQTQLIAQLNQTIQELKEQLNKNSKNSSKPPSSDGFKKPAPKSLRKAYCKKAGGQNGHQGTHLAVITASDKIVKHMPSACEGCPHYQICKGTAFFYVFSKPRLRTTSNNNFFITSAHPADSSISLLQELPCPSSVAY